MCDPCCMHLWRHIALAAFAGTAVGLCPPDGALTWLCWPVGLIALAHSITENSWVNGVCGLLFGVLWFGISLRWFPGLFNSFTSTGSPWPAYAGLIVLQAAPWAFALLIAGWLRRRVPTAVALAIGLGLAEATSGWIQPLPAGITVYTSRITPLLWPAMWGGVALYATLVGAWAGLWQTHRGWALVLSAAALCSAAWQAPVDYDDHVIVGIVQPNVGAFEARRPSAVQGRREALVHLIERAHEAQIVVTPEGAWPDDIGVAGSGRRQRVERALSDLPPLLLGAMGGGGHLPYNSLVVVANGASGDVYHKVDLVPLGERAVAGLGRDSVAPGIERRSLQIGGVVVTPMICYEDLHRTNLAVPSQLIVSASNDGWLGEGPGADTHFAAARVAAIVGGRAVVRPTMNGRSAVFSPDGRTLWSAPWANENSHDDGIVGMVRVPIHQPGWWGARADPWMLLALLISWIGSLRHRRDRDSGPQGLDPV